MNKIQNIYAQSRAVKTSFTGVTIRHLWHKLVYGKSILCSSNVFFNGIKNISTGGTLKVGLKKVGFVFKKDPTYLNVQGRLIIKGNYSIAKGCRFDIGPKGVVEIGEGGFINANSHVIIMHKLSIGNNCSIAWDTQFLDEDFHVLSYEGKDVSNNNEITIGNNVWIGCSCYIYKGSSIADGCVVAANSVIRGKFTEKNTLIAGNPAKIIKRDVNWE
ncbi:acyltransferase [Mucilaginibacter endophyticus]|uniref:acyltransferase n=1 Tax=Mucilaginibacter endophyticus TaxID=2675003 RepID=UPI000E0D4B06|nr:acyltransferase [Mucilaginibacter endophyticus]